MKRKFVKPKTDVVRSELSLDIEKIASGIAKELLTGTSILIGQLTIQDKCKVLQTLMGYYVAANNVNPDEEHGGGFNEYRGEVEAAGGGGRGNSRGEGTVIQLTRPAGAGEEAAAADAGDEEED